MDLYIRNISELAGAMEITKYPNSPLVKSKGGKPVLVAYDGDKEYILGYITKGDTSNPIVIYSQYISGSIGHSLNDLYNNVQNPDDLSSTTSNKNRTVLLGNSQFIGQRFHDGVDGVDYGFKNKMWYVTKDYGGDSGQEAPVAPNKDDEHHYVSLDSGNKMYQSASGTLHEANAVRVNIGVGTTDIHSYGTWDKALLTVETPSERTARVITEGTYASGARVGFPDPSTYHIYNFVDNSSFFMGKSIVEIEKASTGTAYAKTVWDAEGTKIQVFDDGVISLKVATAELIIDKNNVHIKGATLNYDGDLYVSGDLIVSGSSTLITDVDMVAGKVIVDATGKLTTTGGNALG